MQNPLAYTDPTGEAPFLACALNPACAAAVTAGIGALTNALFDLGSQLLDNGGNLQCVDKGSLALSAGIGALPLGAVGALGSKILGNYATKGLGDAARRLGLKLDDIPITNGVARAKINIADTLNPKDIGKLKDALRSRGATRAEIDTGLIANSKLDAFLRRRVQDGKPFNGGTVRPSTSKGSDFTIDFGL